MLPEAKRLARKPKSRGLAAMAAFLLGGIGAHRFYLGNTLAGIVYLMFSWTLIPILVGWVDAIRLATMEEGDFHERYSR